MDKNTPDMGEKSKEKGIKLNGMTRYILRRVLIAAITLFVIMFILFMLLSLMPGSPFNNEEKLSPDQLAALRAHYGLDKPVIQRFFIYMWNMLHGDFGVSYNIQQNMPINRMVGARLPVTLGIGLEAGILGAVVGLILGIVAALKQRTFWDAAATLVGQFALARLVESRILLLELCRHHAALGFRKGTQRQTEGILVAVAQVGCMLDDLCKIHLASSQILHYRRVSCIEGKEPITQCLEKRERFQVGKCRYKHIAALKLHGIELLNALGDAALV